jgi:hypothetical protein
MEDIDTCLRCGSDLEHGSVVGQMIYLNWLPDGESAGVTTYGKEHLARGSATSGPRLPAARCPSCGLGYFEASVEGP